MHNPTTSKIKNARPEQDHVSAALELPGSSREAWHKPNIWVISSASEQTAGKNFNNPSVEIYNNSSAAPTGKVS
jgi:hypothetical protein